VLDDARALLPSPDSRDAPAHAASEVAGRLRRLSGRCEQLALMMDFAFLYDPGRRLLSNGYDVERGRLDGAYYDLLATEARLASFMAIAKGDVEHRHWFQLGRPMAPIGLSPALMSWGGSMFEHLMPMIFLRHDPGTLLGRSCRVATRRQISYGRRKRVCWGI